MNHFLKTLVALTIVMSVGPFSNVEAKSISAKVKCMGAVFDGTGNAGKAKPEIFNLALDTQQFGLFFKGEKKGVRFTVTVDKKTGDVFGNIESPNGEVHSFQGAFSSQGQFEYSHQVGGNIMMPEKSLSVFCQVFP